MPTTLVQTVFHLRDGSGVDLGTRMTEFQDPDAVERAPCALDFPVCWAHSFPPHGTFSTLVPEGLRGLGDSRRQAQV